MDLLELSSLCLGEGTQISHRFLISSCENTQQKFVCQEKNFVEYSEAIALSLSTQGKNDTSYNYIYTYFFFFLTKKLVLSLDFVCVNYSVYGYGKVGDKAVGPCEPNRVGQKVAVCRATGTWELLQDGCILQPIQDLLEQSQVTYS